MSRYVHGCWVTGADRVCEDGTKGCSREHPLTDAPEPLVEARPGEHVEMTIGVVPRQTLEIRLGTDGVSITPTPQSGGER